MNDYFDGINYTLAVITLFALLLAIATAFAYVSLRKENDELRAKLNRNPSSVSKLCHDCPDHEGCMTGMPCDFVRMVHQAELEEQAKYQPSLLGDDTLAMLRA